MSTMSLWSRRNPAAEFDALIRHAFPAHSMTRPFPAAEVVREGEDALVRLEMPGVNVDEVTVEAANGRLTISGERRQAHSDDEATHVREFRYGAFERTFRLPASVSTEQISADYHAGILTVRVTGAYAGATPRKIEITGASSAPVLDAEQSEAEQTESEQAEVAA